MICLIIDLIVFENNFNNCTGVVYVGAGGALVEGAIFLFRRTTKTVAHLSFLGHIPVTIQSPAVHISVCSQTYSLDFDGEVTEAAPRVWTHACYVLLRSTCSKLHHPIGSLKVISRRWTC